MVKRYLRLSLPVFVISIIVFLMMNSNMFYNTRINDVVGSSWLANYYLSKASLSSLLFSSFVSVWISGDTTFSTAFWMLPYIFIGSYILAMIINNKKPRALIVLFCCRIAFL